MSNGNSVNTLVRKKKTGSISQTSIGNETTLQLNQYDSIGKDSDKKQCDSPVQTKKHIDDNVLFLRESMEKDSGPVASVQAKIFKVDQDIQALRDNNYRMKKDLTRIVNYLRKERKTVVEANHKSNRVTELEHRLMTTSENLQRLQEFKSKLTNLLPDLQSTPRGTGPSSTLMSPCIEQKVVTAKLKRTPMKMQISLPTTVGSVGEDRTPSCNQPFSAKSSAGHYPDQVIEHRNVSSARSVQRSSTTKQSRSASHILFRKMSSQGPQSLSNTSLRSFKPSVLQTSGDSDIRANRASKQRLFKVSRVAINRNENKISRCDSANTRIESSSQANDFSASFSKAHRPNSNAKREISVDNISPMLSLFKQRMHALLDKYHSNEVDLEVKNNELLKILKNKEHK